MGKGEAQRLYWPMSVLKSIWENVGHLIRSQSNKNNSRNCCPGISAVPSGLLSDPPFFMKYSTYFAAVRFYPARRILGIQWSFHCALFLSLLSPSPVAADKLFSKIFSKCHWVSFHWIIVIPVILFEVNASLLCTHSVLAKGQCA